ncbi:hypothetical protein ACI797_11760 [Geodermatophilus sp. SYSU D00691]
MSTGTTTPPSTQASSRFPLTLAVLLQLTFDLDAPADLHVAHDYAGPLPEDITITVDATDQVAESNEEDNADTCSVLG